MDMVSELEDKRPTTTQRPATAGVVMVVDDNPANLNLMEEMLRPRGFVVRSFPRGRMALVSASETPPDLILLDVNMPEMTGYEVCDQLKSSAQLSRIPVIFLSALNSQEDKLRGFRCGCRLHFQALPGRRSARARRCPCQAQALSESDRTRQPPPAGSGGNAGQKIADGHLATIFAIAKLAAARDNQTGIHLERIQIFCELLAEGLSHKAKYKTVIDRAWIRNISQASPLHDIGKVAIPDHILLKPGTLTPEEFGIMKTHTTLGAQTLRAVHQKYPDNELIAMGIEAAQSHHERWDGSGYPEGLREDRIPLCARILAVADCYDALRSKRCYKPQVPHDEACAIIRENGGTPVRPLCRRCFRRTRGNTFVGGEL